MELQGMRIDKEDLKLSHIAPDSKDGNPVLSCLLVRDDNIVAADGFALVVRTKRNEDGTRNRGEVMIPLNVIPMLRLGKNEHVSLEETDGDEMAANIVHGMLTMATVTFKPNEGEYPDYEQLFSGKQTKFYVSINIELLRHLLKAMPKDGVVDIGIEGNRLEFSMGGDEDDETHAILMAMERPEGYLPNWYRRVNKETGEVKWP